MGEEEFLAKSRLRIDTRTLEGIVHDSEAKARTERIFVEPGIYQFHISDNVDTGFENMLGTTINVKYE